MENRIEIDEEGKQKIDKKTKCQKDHNQNIRVFSGYSMLGF